MKDEPITKTECAVAGLGIAWLLVGAIAAGLLVGGCKSIEVEYRGKALATWTDTNGVVRAVCDDLGKPIFFDKGWVVDYFQHGTFTKMDEMHAEAGVAKLDLNGYQSGMDSNLVALVNVSLKGTAELAAKIGTAIATCGASAAAEGGAAGVISLAKQAYNRFVSRGGNESKAVVSSAADGTVTVSDGSIGVQCANGVCSDCADGSCTVK